MTELCPPHKRQDAISAITLVESAAMLITMGLFGLIFAAFSQIDKPSLTFFCNAVSGLLVNSRTEMLIEAKGVCSIGCHGIIHDKVSTSNE
jgi:hypothetical protein